ncbi:unnamed protein product [Brassicogethes aeneus]|uniref:Cytochrome P450 n=1 Tax=Brassicogethes aeneus TaxID=1431903 RepID=A0A9P0AXT7_BRAAE|nr:unnamed protein product [Brassicogethes aeneus]
MVLITNTLTYDLGIFLVTLITAFVIYIKWVYTYWQKKGLATEPTVIPFGNGAKVATCQQNIGELFSDMYFKFKSKGLKHGGAYFLMKPFYVPVDLEIVKGIMQNDFGNFVNRGMYVNEKADTMSTNLFNLEGGKWKSLRAKLSPTFTSGKLKMMFNTLSECGLGLNDMIEEYARTGEELNIKDILQRFSIDIIGSVSFGIECNSIKNPESEFFLNGKRLFSLEFTNILRFLSPIALPHSVLKFFNFNSFNVSVTNFFDNIIKQNVEYREKNNITRPDFFHLLLQLKNRGKVCDDDKLQDTNKSTKESALTLDELTAQSFVFFIAGYETTSTTMTFALSELALNQEIQEKARKEIEMVAAKHNGELSYEAIKDMTYMEQIINETLRKYPPVPILLRKCNKTYPVPGTDVVIEKDDMVAISSLAIQNDPEIYENPEKFDPDRFSTKNTASRHQFAHIPFGEGPRICIGMRFALMEAKVGMAAILKNYNITLSKRTKVPIQLDPKSFISAPKDGIWIHAKRISTD